MACAEVGNILQATRETTIQVYAKVYCFNDQNQIILNQNGYKINLYFYIIIIYIFLLKVNLIKDFTMNNNL